MKKYLLSVFRAISSGESCSICAVIVTIICVVALWQVIGALLGAVQEHFALQNIAYWRPGN